MLRVGLTGGIACGKSQVLARLRQAGLHTLDLDRVAHELMAPGGAAYADVVGAFGAQVLRPDGHIDRKALGAVVFADEQARAQLNSLVHPRVRAEEARWAESCAAEPGAVAVTDAALLVESGVHLRFDRLVVVYCDEGQQRQRLMARDGLGEADARARIGAQMPLAEKRRFAHFELDTSGGLAETLAAADGLAEQLKALAAQPREPHPFPVRAVLGGLAFGPRQGPRGLDPVGLLQAVDGAKGWELEALARMLQPPATGPWYRAAQPGQGEPRPESLCVALLAGMLARSAADRAPLVVAALSLATLTHREPEPVATACAYALLLHEIALRGRLDEGLRALLPQVCDEVRPRAGEADAPRLSSSLDAALEHAGDPAVAREAGGALAGAMAGWARGLAPEDAPQDLVEVLRAMARAGRSG